MQTDTIIDKATSSYICEVLVYKQYCHSIVYKIRVMDIVIFFIL